MEIRKNVFISLIAVIGQSFKINIKLLFGFTRTKRNCMLYIFHRISHGNTRVDNRAGTLLCFRNGIGFSVADKLCFSAILLCCRKHMKNHLRIFKRSVIGLCLCRQSKAKTVFFKNNGENITRLNGNVNGIGNVTGTKLEHNKVSALFKVKQTLVAEPIQTLYLAVRSEINKLSVEIK